MFQRQARQPFPVRNIIALAVAVILFLLFLLKSTQQEPPATPPQEHIIE